MHLFYATTIESVLLGSIELQIRDTVMKFPTFVNKTQSINIYNL